MNSSSQRDVIKRLRDIKTNNNNAKIYIGIIIKKGDAITIKNDIKFINGQTLYKIVTGDNDAFSKTLDGIKKCLCNIKKINPVSLEFLEMCGKKII